MNLRATSIYISTETRRHLWIIAKARGLDNPDAAGEELLSEAISEKYPALVSHQKKIEELELAVIENMKVNYGG